MVEIIAELATGHGGDVSLAEDMIAAAAEAGAHTVKIQSYTLARLNPNDPQADWLTKAHLDVKAHERLIKACQRHQVKFLSTPFDWESFQMLRNLGQTRFKVASTGHVPFISPGDMAFFIKSWPWGRLSPQRELMKRGGDSSEHVEADLTAIPLYPTPLEAVSAAPLLDGWSDHTIGTAACQHMLSRGARIIEAHFCLPGRSRQMPWDKTSEQFREIRDWADAVETMTTGVATHFRERWTA